MYKRVYITHAHMQTYTWHWLLTSTLFLYVSGHPHHHHSLHHRHICHSISTVGEATQGVEEELGYKGTTFLLLSTAQVRYTFVTSCWFLCVKVLVQPLAHTNLTCTNLKLVSSCVCAVDELDCRVLEVEILQKHIDGLESINAITVVDRIAYQLYKKPQEESCVSVCVCVCVCVCGWVGG